MTSAERAEGGDASLHRVTRAWGTGWRRYVFPAFWLIYLLQTASGVHKHSHGVAQVIGYLLIVAFAITYLIALPNGWDSKHSQLFLASFGLAVALTVAIGFFSGPDVNACAVYLAVLSIAGFAARGGLLVGVLVLLAMLLPRVVPGWGGQIDWGSGLTVALVAFAMFGFFMIIKSNIALSLARSEVARLAAENERSRIARDLHDLLGHSLTTITVKAGLARRLSDRDPERAAEEITEVEQLARRTLGEVRAAVSGYRELTITGELATAREVLRAAGIEATLPGSADVVDSDGVEPFAWVVREAVTNVVRHSRADHCMISVGPRWIEITDDGRGGGSALPTDGNGLRGLSERLAAIGATVATRSRNPGWTVRAELAESRDGEPGVRSTVDAL